MELQLRGNIVMKMTFARWRWILAGAVVMGVLPSIPALTITFDYTYDTSGFFNSQARRDLLNDAAANLTSRITDSLSAIVPSGENTWTANPFDPNNPNNILSIANLVVPADTLVVYVGAANLGSGTLGEGGPGGDLASGITQAWLDTVAGRGQSGALATTPTDFGPWGGTVTFNNTAAWYFDTDPSTMENIGSLNDFYSVALHELGHVLGIGTAGSWTAQSNGGTSFTGANAMALNGGSVALSPDGGHWAQGTMSTVVGTGVAQEVAMDPSLTQGTRKLFTALDYAALEDIGWQLAGIPEASTLTWVAALGLAGVIWRLRTGTGQKRVSATSSR